MTATETGQSTGAGQAGDHSARIWFPPDANSTLVVAEKALHSRGGINLIVVDEQQHLQ